MAFGKTAMKSSRLQKSTLKLHQAMWRGTGSPHPLLTHLGRRWSYQNPQFLSILIRQRRLFKKHGDVSLSDSNKTVWCVPGRFTLLKYKYEASDMSLGSNDWQRCGFQLQLLSVLWGHTEMGRRNGPGCICSEKEARKRRRMTRVNDEQGRGERLEWLKGVCVRERAITRAVKRDGSFYVRVHPSHLLVIVLCCLKTLIAQVCFLVIVSVWKLSCEQCNIKTTAVSSSAQCRQEVWSHRLRGTDNYGGFELQSRHCIFQVWASSFTSALL